MNEKLADIWLSEVKEKGNASKVRDSAISLILSKGLSLSDQFLERLNRYSKLPDCDSKIAALMELHYPETRIYEDVLSPISTSIDVTNTRKQPYTTGIQRIVRNLCKSSPEAQLVYFDPDGRVRATTGSSPRENRVSRANIQILLYGTKLWHRIFNSDEERNWLSFLKPLAVKMGEPIRTALLKSSRKFAAIDPLIDVISSHLIVAEVPTNSAHVDALIGLAQSGKLRTTVLLHDLIPLVHPELTPNDPRHIFLKFLQFVCTADRVICISDEVERHFLQYCEMQSKANNGQKVFVLSYPVKPMFESNNIDSRIQEINKKIGFNAEGTRYFLTVGTLTRRKNLGLLIQAMDYLDGPNADVKLLFIGRQGFDANYIEDELHLGINSEKKVVILEGTSDAELEFLISRSSGVLFPSTAEGFGLPIIEAAAANKRVVVSDIEPMRTVGKLQGAIVLPPDDIFAWRDAMSKILENEMPIGNNQIDDVLSWESWAKVVCD